LICYCFARGTSPSM